MNYNDTEKFVLFGAKLYAVSNYGRVMNMKTGKFITPEITHNGYERVILRNSKGIQIHYPVHRLVASLFIPRPPECTEIHHIDGNKRNNHVDNLMWISTPNHHKTHRVIKKYKLI